MFTYFDLESEEIFNDDYCDIISLKEFIECCEDRFFIDDDGFAGEILLNGKIIFKQSGRWFYPSDVLEYKEQLLEWQNKLGELHVVWYNK